MDKKQEDKLMSDLFNLMFIGIVMLFLVMGVFFALFFPSDVIEYENRKSEQIVPLTADSFFDGSFADSVEKALADNVLFAVEMKKTYNDINSAFVSAFTNATVAGCDIYVKLGEYYLFKGDYILYPPSKPEYVNHKIIKRASDYNRMINKYPELDFYVYYVERESDINFETGEKVGTYELLCENLDLPPQRAARFEITDFEQFTKYFYKTDHHWNADGSYKGYTEILKLLECEDVPLKAAYTVTFPNEYVGAKVRTNPKARGYTDAFSVNRYLFPEMTVTMVGGIPAYDYGEQEHWLYSKPEHSTYNEYYGDDFGEVVFDTQLNTRENLLVIGESYDNAVLKLLASHFNRTHAIDLRFYEPYMNEKFDFDAYVKDNDIDKVLLVGAVDYFVTDEFMPEIP